MTPDFTLDAGESGCGELVLLIFQKMKALSPGQTLLVLAHDAAAETDIPAWCRSTGNLLLEQNAAARPKRFVIQKQLDFSPGDSDGKATYQPDHGSRQSR